MVAQSTYTLIENWDLTEAQALCIHGLIAASSFICVVLRLRDPTLTQHRRPLKSGCMCMLVQLKIEGRYQAAHQLSPAASEQLVHATQLTDLAHHGGHLAPKLLLDLLHFH